MSGQILLSNFSSHVSLTHPLHKTHEIPKDYYSILGVTPKMSLNDFKKSYRERGLEDVFRELFKVSSNLMINLCSDSVDDGSFDGNADTWLDVVMNSMTNSRNSTSNCEPCLKKKTSGL